MPAGVASALVANLRLQHAVLPEVVRRWLWRRVCAILSQRSEGGPGGAPRRRRVPAAVAAVLWALAFSAEAAPARLRLHRDRRGGG